jgi:acyl-coenzyme A thioesterase 9
MLNRLNLCRIGRKVATSKNFRFASGLSLSRMTGRPESMYSLGDNSEKWGSELLFTHDFVMRHREYKGIIPSCSPKEPLSNDGKRSREASFLEVKLPFSTNKALKENMANYTGEVIRYGKLFEIIDCLAGDVGCRHCEGSEGITIVTASVDGMNIADADISAEHDLILQGYLTYVGTSSMEIHVNLIQKNNLVASTQFIMVARHGADGVAYKIPGYSLRNNIEIDDYYKGKIRASERKIQSKESLSVAAPKTAEVEHIHQLYLKSKIMQQSQSSKLLLKNNEKYMSQTIVISTEIMHPQNRNAHGKIFGGEIMRKAFELGYITAVSFLGERNTQFVAVDDINFLKPVNIGSIIMFNGMVTYSSPETNLVIVEVTVEQSEPGTMIREQTNTLTYVFKKIATNNGNGNDTTIPTVVPMHYGEFISYLEGQRTHEEIKNDYINKK